jgi:hypothetical protein
MWVIDIRHWLGEDLLDAGLPQLKFKVKKLGEIITYATASKLVSPLMSDLDAGGSHRGSLVSVSWR